MDFLYQPILEGCDTWTTDVNSYLSHYFLSTGEGAFTTTFGIAVGVAAIFLLIFYGLFGYVLDKFSTRLVYWITFGLTFLVTWVATNFIVIGSANALTGVFGSINDYKESLQIACGTDIAAVEELNVSTNALVQNLSDGCDVTLYLCLINSIVAVALFFLCSILVKRFTRYATAVPF